MKKFVIEREIPGVGDLDSCGLAEAAGRSNGVLRELGAGIQWQESFVVADRTYCIYLAEDESLIKEHAARSGFPASRVSEVRAVIDPTTAVG